MSRRKEVLTAVGSLACALGIGFVMQSGDSPQAPQGQMNVAVNTLGGGLMLDVTDIALTSAEVATSATDTLDAPDMSEDIYLAAANNAQVDMAPPTPLRAVPEPTCVATATATAVGGAMVDLTLSAPCMPNERLTVHHEKMLFTQTTSASGMLSITVPALSKDAVYILAFTNGDGAVAETTVDAIALYDRVVLQWRGDAGFQIHAREFGSGYDGTGHVWAGSPKPVMDAIDAMTGFVTQLGDASAPDGLFAEVYSYPTGISSRDGTIALTVEAEVTAANCGDEIEAQTLEILEDQKFRTRSLTLSVPDCDARGDFLVLNNLLQDLKVASR